MLTLDNVKLSEDF